MPQPRPADTDRLPLFKHLIEAGDGAPAIEDKLMLLQVLRKDAGGAAVDRQLLEEIAHLRLGMDQIQRTQQELRKVLDSFRDAPWHPATYLGFIEVGEQRAALVAQGNDKRAVAISDALNPESLRIGDEVLLGHEMNVLVARSSIQSFRSGETAVFEKMLDDGRLVIRCRDEEVVLQLAEDLRQMELKSGDLIRWDRSAWLACERVERSQGRHWFVETTPPDTFQEIGGLDREIGQIQKTIELHMFRRDIVQKYRAQKRGSLLLVGPPGNGKTKVARALANWLALIGKPGRSHFINIKPNALNSMWFGKTEENYREVFRAAREVSEAEPDVPVVIFIDEVDSVGSVRGSSMMRVDERVLTAFMAELDGFEAGGNVLVVAATNRRDALDPALLRPGRLGDLVVEIPRPNRKAAAAIFDRYLHRDIPYASNGHGDDAEAARLDIIQTALSRIYASNGDDTIATLTFRDGKQKAITARDLISGAAIRNIVHVAIERACFREMETETDGGVSLGNVLGAIEEEFRNASRVLTPANCHKHLSGLPQDVDVVRVELMNRKVPSHEYLHS